MIIVRGTHAGLDVTAGAQLKVNAFGLQVLHQPGIFVTSHAVSDPGWFEGMQRLPYTARSQRLSGMSSAVEPTIYRKAKRRHMGINREARFVASQIQGNDMS